MNTFYRSDKILKGILFILLLLPVLIYGQNLTPQQLLGKQLYFDLNLSSPAGQSCASCHHPSAGYADPNHSLPVSKGVIPGRYGNRSSPTSAYVSYSPSFQFAASQNRYVGGQFWDGRAADLVAQAKGPFLNPLEMNNASQAVVVEKVRTSSYASQFISVFGADAFQNVDQAYNNIAKAIADYEGTSELNKFTSKFDFYLRGGVSLTAQELRGLNLFNGKGKCSSCHPSTAGPYYGKPLFTNFAYDNLGIPKNPANPFYSLPAEFNPAGANWVDYGLGGVLGLAGEMGKMKVPTLRNIAVTAPYAHNGYFKTLAEIVTFYNKRDMGCGGKGGGMGGGCGMGGGGGMGMWGAPEVAQNINKTIGSLGLSCKDEGDIIAFLNTLTDGYILGKEAAGDEDILSAPARFTLQQNFPNPFNPTTVIKFSIAEENAQVSIKVYNSIGEEIAILVNEFMPAGNYEVPFDASGLVSGIYLYTLNAGNFVSSKKMILVK